MAPISINSQLFAHTHTWRSGDTDTPYTPEPIKHIPKLKSHVELFYSAAFLASLHDLYLSGRVESSYRAQLR